MPISNHTNRDEIRLVILTILLVLQMVCDRVTFQSSTYPYIKITIDSNLKIQRDGVKEGHIWQMMTGDDSGTDNDNFVHFPFDVIKISIEESEESLPHWWHELVQSKLVRCCSSICVIVAAILNDD